MLVNTYRISVENRKVKRPLRIARHGLEKKIKVDLEETESESLD
jgi:hypothetical protein